MPTITLPELNEGERYIGAIGDAAGNLTHIILLPGDIEANWKDATAWAESIGGSLPNRGEQALLFSTAKDAFEERAYWSCQEHSSEPGWAWCQLFTSGGQGYGRKYGELRARAVRRLPIQ